MKILYLNEQATKGEYTKALQSYHEYLVEIKSAQRDEAAAYDMRGISVSLVSDLLG